HLRCVVVVFCIFVLLFLCFFFLYCYTPYLHLPSFPTRRSSDLMQSNSYYGCQTGIVRSREIPGQVRSRPCEEVLFQVRRCRPRSEAMSGKVVSAQFQSQFPLQRTESGN